MKILDRYIAGAVAFGTGVALLVILGLDVFFSIINQIDDVGKGSYTMSRMLQYVVFTLPRSLYEMFPTAALIGSLMGMGMLAANSELTAMRASGLSIWRIVRSVLQVGVIMLVFVVALGEFVAPVAEQYGQNLRAMALDNRISFMGRHGLWVRDEARFIYVNKIIDTDKLAGLSIFEFDSELRMESATNAAQAGFQEGEWVLRDVQQSVFRGDSVEVQQQDKVTWPLLLTPDLINIVMLKPQNMSVHDIRRFVAYLEENGLDTQQYRYAFWSRFVTPVSALVMLFVSVPFVFGGLRSVGAGQRIFVGILTGIGFYLLNQMAGQVGQVYGLNPMFASITPALVFLLFGIRALRRI